MKTDARRLSLRGQLMLLLSAILLLAGLGQAFYVLNAYRMQVEQNTISSHAVISRTDALFKQTAGSLERACAAIAGDQNVQAYLKMQNGASPENITERSTLRNVIGFNLEGISRSNNAILDIALVDQGGGITSYLRVIDYSLLTLVRSAYGSMGDDAGGGRLVAVQEQAGEASVIKGIAYVRPVYHIAGDYGKRSQVLGTCIIWCRSAAFDEIVNASSATENAMVLLSDSNSRTIAQKIPTGGQIWTETVSGLINQYQSTQEDRAIRLLTQDGKDYYVLMQTDTRTGWQTINITPRQEIFKDTARVLRLGIGLTAVTAAVTLALGFIMIRGVTTPLWQIVASMRRIGRGERDLRLAVTLNNEFGMIGGSINDMLDHISAAEKSVFDMQAGLYEAELAQRDEEMRMLQSQINPHFLYNTFECIRSIAAVQKVPEIVTLSSSIANILRYSAKGGIFTTVREELDCVRDYFKITTIRYAGRIGLSIEVEPELYSCRALKLFLLPLVENAVKHGLEQTESDVHVRICGRREENGLLFTVHDSGNGIDKKQAEVINSMLLASESGTPDAGRNSIGLKNIHMRLCLYGDQYGLRVEKGPGRGTTVTIRMGNVEEMDAPREA